VDGRDRREAHPAAGALARAGPRARRRGRVRRGDADVGADPQGRARPDDPRSPREARQGRIAGMRFSLWPSLNRSWADVVDAVRHAEATGWDGVYVADHFMNDANARGPVETPTLEATAALAALAG